MTGDRQQGKGYEEQPETYLRQCRKIALMPSNARVLSASDAHRATGFRYPAMVLPIVNERHRLLGAHLTFLTADASENAAGHNGNIRRMFGPVKGGFVRLGPINPDRPLIVGEGVETVLSAMQITGLSGIAALSAKNLGNDVIPPPCSAILIAADNDKAGREAANALSERLNSPARPVSIIYPPERGDWNDELRESDDLGALKELFERARPEEPSADNSKSDVIGMTTFLTLQFPKRLCLLKPWLKTGDLAMLIADGGVGKTHLALSIGYAVASGRSLMDWTCEHRAKVLYVDGEMPGEQLQQWLNELGPALPDEDFGFLTQSHLALENRDIPDLNTEEGRKFLDAEIERSGATLIILDSVSTLVQSGVESDNESWRAIQQWAIKHRGRGRTILYLQHTNAGKLRHRGPSSKRDVLGTAILLKKRDDLTTDTSTAVELVWDKTRGFFGKDAMPRILRFNTKTANGYVEWCSELKTGEHVKAVGEMLDQGMKQSEIAKQLGLTEGRISQIVKEMRASEGEDSEV
jgi:putative DNA primase/helicase